jgi:hypothetical protein
MILVPTISLPSKRRHSLGRYAIPDLTRLTGFPVFEATPRATSLQIPVLRLLRTICARAFAQGMDAGTPQPQGIQAYSGFPIV